ncbi:hypothetical protein C3L33_09992, partial [Rhododendron williamsianum]
MASSLINLTTILSLLLILVPPLLLLAPPSAAEEDYYAINTKDRPSGLRVRGRLLGSTDEPELVRNNTSCMPGNNVCDGVWSQPSNGIVLAHIYCCKKHCRNVLTDKNNCGACENKCPFGYLCCSGNCTNVAYDPMHCGKCKTACLPGVLCEYGSCGYA